MAETNDLPAPKTGMARMVLKRNYVPAGDHDIIGYDKPARMMKNAVGEMIEVEPAAFVAGESAPPPYPGVGYGPITDKGGKILRNAKIWKGTTIDVPVAEAKNMRRLAIAEAEIA